MKITIVLDEYLMDMEVRGLSHHTIRGAYETIIQVINRVGIETLEELNTRAIKLYIKSMQDSGIKATSINSRLRHLKMFFKFMLEEELIEKNPMDKIQSVKQQKNIIKTYTKQDIEKVLNYYDGKDFMSIRNRTMIMMYCETGIRSTELRTIKFSDVHDGSMRILGKGNKVRYVPISLPLKRQMVRYERARKVFMFKPSRFLNHNECEFYFVGKSRNQLHHTIPLRIIDDMKNGRGAYKKDIELSVKPTVHHFRRYYAQQMLNNVDLYTLSRLMGHSSVLITQRYIEGIEDSEIIKKGMNSPLTNG